ncbi:hypothetical protein ACFVVP_37390 [Streptomyces sp. NPDC058128]|uniref:hypothetical protein n=1 Tax=Streptomyces sp. NPDC058128 TaxID=3346352 RepID=UPI0036F06B8F
MLILDRLGDACGASEDEPPTAVRVIQAQRKLAKLDFLVRNPDYLADQIITACEEGRLTRDRLLDARAVLEEREPELHTYRMLRNKHGAYESMNNALAVLRHPGLIKVVRAGKSSDTHVRRRDYYLLSTGAAFAERLRNEVPVLAWYDQQVLYVRMVTEGMSAEQLKALQYEHAEYAGTPVGQIIAGIAERVRARLAVALEREGLA